MLIRKCPKCGKKRKKIIKKICSRCYHKKYVKKNKIKIYRYQNRYQKRYLRKKRWMERLGYVPKRMKRKITKDSGFLIITRVRAQHRRFLILYNPTNLKYVVQAFTDNGNEKRYMFDNKEKAIKFIKSTRGLKWVTI